ncbi:MAG: XdhC/CoxI family protein [Acidimicrobiia bacterium]
MREIIDDLLRWRSEGMSCAVARVVDLEGSGPRDPGAAMAVSADGEVVGSVSGGCVEGAVVSEALDVMATGERRVVSFGYSDADAVAVGLTCGGTVRLYVEPFTGTVFEEFQKRIANRLPASLATAISGPGTGRTALVSPDSETVGTLGNADLDRVVVRDARGELEAGRSLVRHYGEHGEAGETEVSVFIESFAPPPTMLIAGAVDFTAALVRVASTLGFVVTVCDAREVFATPERFPGATDVIVSWPQAVIEKLATALGPRDAVCILTHDAKFDVPAIVAALETDVGYIGVMGSRRTHDDRVLRLRDAGVDDAGLARLRAPIGLDIGARTPEETAVSICAEIIALRTGTDAPALTDGTGPIHR